MTEDFSSLINRNSSRNLSRQLEDIFRDYINEGKWKPDTLIPSESVLSKCFGVSRSTVRAALISMEQDKLLYRIQGKGTAVLSKQLSSSLPVAGLRRAIHKAGLENNEKLNVLLCEKRKAPDDVARKLNIPINDAVIYVERTSILAGSQEPRSLQYIYIPEKIADAINLSEIKSHFFHELFERAGIFMCQTKEWLSVSGTNPHESECLKVNLRTPAFVIEELRFNQNKVPYYYMKIIRPGGSLKFEFSSIQDEGEK